MHISAAADLETGPRRGVKDMLDDNAVAGAPKSGARRFWTNKEIKTLKDLYPLYGVTQPMLDALPGRTASAIYNRAGKEGVTSPSSTKLALKGRKREVWKCSEMLEKAIVEFFQKPKLKRDDVKVFARQMGRPYWWITRKGRKLAPNGAVPRFKELPWSQPELDILERLADKSDLVISRALNRAGFKRSEVAVHVKVKRLQLDRSDPRHFSASAFAKLLGLDNKTVTTWCLKGLIRGERRGTARVEAQGGDMHWIHKRTARQFIIDNANLIDLRKVDRTWFIDFLAHPIR